MVSGETGKIGIIRRSRESKTPQRTRYKDARTAFRAALLDPAGERRILAEAANAFQQRSDDSSISDFRRDDALKSLEAVNAFGGMRQQFAGHDFVAAPARQAPLALGGVEVPVTLDLLIHRNEEIGGLLFRLTQFDDTETDSAASKRREMGLYAATLVLMQITANLAGNRRPAYPICWSVEVQSQDIHVAPRTFARRSQDMESACRFIAAMWDRV